MPELSIACTQCNHVNEVQRIYCHNCGTKLDRSKVIEQQQVAAKNLVTAQTTQKRVQKMLAPGASATSRWPFTLLRTVIYAAITAGIILAAMPPANTPPVSKDLPAKPEAARIAIESLLVATPGTSTVIAPAAVNDYLQVYAKIRFAKDGLLTAERTFGILDKDTIGIILHNTVKGVPFYLGVTHRVVMENNLLSVTLTGISIGRLNLPPIAMPILSNFFPPLLAGLDREHMLLTKLGGFTIKKEGITVTSRAVAPR